MDAPVFTSLKIFFALFTIAFGVDKFIPFLPTCSLVTNFPPYGMEALGIIEILLGGLLLFNIQPLLTLRLMTAIMIGAILLHLLTSSYDFGGAVIGSIVGLILIFKTKKIIANDH